MLGSCKSEICLMPTERCRSSRTAPHPLLTFRCLLADLERDDAPASRIAIILKRLGSSTYDVAIKIITDIGSATGKKMLGL